MHHVLVSVGLQYHIGIGSIDGIVQTLVMLRHFHQLYSSHSTGCQTNGKQD